MNLKKLSVFLIVVSILFFCVSRTAFSAVSAEERAALIAFYKATNGDNWKKKDGWKTPPLHSDGFAKPGTEGKWAGITVSRDRVISLVTKEFGLKGVIPNEITKLRALSRFVIEREPGLTGIIPKEIGHMPELSYFVIFITGVSGNIPPELGNLKKLTYMELSYNELSGPIPATLGNLVHLRGLRLLDNKLSGSIPMSLGNFGREKKFHMYLGGNLLTGEIPISIIKIKNLEMVSFQNNALNITNPDTLDLIKTKKVYWDRQTLPPKDLKVTNISETSATISWTTVSPYGAGGHEVEYRVNPNGPWEKAGSVDRKSINSFTVQGLKKETGYSFRVRTKTDPHRDNRHTVYSLYSTEAQGKTKPGKPETFTLTAGVSVRIAINVNPIDVNGEKNYRNDTTRTYKAGQAVKLNAPGDFHGNPFAFWVVDGNMVKKTNINVKMGKNHTVRAVYSLKGGCALAVDTMPMTNINIQIDKKDMANKKDGLSNLVRNYKKSNNPPTVTITPKGVFKGKRLSAWLIDGVKKRGRVMKIKMDKHHSVVVIYK